MPAKKPLTLVVLGDPASGKGVQANKLAEKYKCKILDVGKMLRLEASENPKGPIAKAMQRGRPAPTMPVQKMVRSAILKLSPQEGFILSQNPMLFPEAQVVVSAMKKAGREPICVYIAIPLKEALIRSARRAALSKDQKRIDDNKEITTKRHREYKKIMASTIDLLKKNYPYAKISGVGSVNEITKRLCVFIKKNS